MRRLLKSNSYRHQWKLFGAVSSSIVIQQTWQRKHKQDFTVALQPDIRIVATAAVLQQKYNTIDIFFENLLQSLKATSLKLSTAIRYCSRVFEYLLYGIPLAIVAPIAYYSKDISPVLEESLWIYIIWTVEQLGPTFIKFAQWASTRPG